MVGAYVTSSCELKRQFFLASTVFNTYMDWILDIADFQSHCGTKLDNVKVTNLGLA